MLCKMMFNGLLTFGDSDTSDFTKESMGASSVDGSIGSDSAARAQYYHNKLLATLQILQNKDETVRVQSESLTVAEGRIAALSARAAQLRRDLDQKASELQALRKSADSKANVDKIDVSISASSLEVEEHRRLVKALQEHLAVVEELYRECFYESAKQEELLELVRASCRGERAGAERLGTVRGVVTAQQCELDKCQDIAVEVETLKSEIREFLNSSNNDSGVWERSSECCPAVGDDLRDIMAQLLQLRDLLNGECTCGLDEENKTMKKLNKTLESDLLELRVKLSELDTLLLRKDDREQELIDQLHDREVEFQAVRNQLNETYNKETSDQGINCDTFSLQLQEKQELLHEKESELTQVRQRCEAHETTIKQLKEELNKAETLAEENARLRREASRLSRQVASQREQCRQLEAVYREREAAVSQLQLQLEGAHARGAALCGEARRVLGAVRARAAAGRERRREQEQTIREQNAIIRTLRFRLRERQIDTESSSVSETNQPTCSKCVRDNFTEIDSWSNNSFLQDKEKHRKNYYEDIRSQNIQSCSKCCQKNEVNDVGCSKDRDRQIRIETSGSEIASCSYAPVPPQRLLRKKMPCVGSKNCHCPEKLKRERGETRAGGNETFSRRHDVHRIAVQTRLSPPLDELIERMELAQSALAAGQRRWIRMKPTER